MKHVQALIAAASIAVLGISAFAADPTVPGDAAQPVPGAAPFAANMSPDGMWFNMPEHRPEVMNAQPWVRPARGQATMLDLGAMVNYLRGAPMEGTQLAFDAPLIVWLPRPDGTFERFRVVESPIMEPGLAALLPGTKTFLGQGLDNPANIVRFDHTLDGAGAGFHAMVLSPDGDYFIDPVSRNDMQNYVSYFKREFRRTHAWACLTEADPNRAPVTGDVDRDVIRAGPTRREYSLAVAATGEYTAFHGGTATAGQNAIVTAMNRVNGVYEREVAVRMILVANNINVVYTNSGTDPYDNNNPSQMLNANTGNLNSIIGSANYDIGHVFSTGGGGVAFLGSVCGGSKGGGVTGTNSPVGDPFTIDYVAHEIGHQFGGNHTFNGTGGSCNGNRASSAAYEPGSATTIMGYAGICGADNVQNNSDAYFHSRSFDEIIAFTTTGGGNGCATQVATGNTAPTVSAGTPFAIPRSTPFTLTATGSDPNGDALTFCWEERELGAAQTLAAADNGSSANFRSFTGTTSPSRTFPRLSTVLGGPAALGEKVYSVARNPASFRVTARDNRAGGGGVNTSDINITVDGVAGPFVVTAPTGGSSFAGGSNLNVTWNVAGTTAVPVATANVRILLSTDGGTTFGTVLAASTPNDGSQSVVLPNVATTAARIRVEAINNIFFNVNPGGNFTLTIAPPATPTGLSATPNPGCVNQNLTLNATVGAGEVCDWFIGNCGLTLVGTGNPLVITPTTSFTNRTYFARARRTSDGATSAACATIQVTVNFNPVAPTSALVDRNNFCASDPGNIVLSAVAGAGTTLRWSTGSCGGTTVGTGANLSIPSPTTTTTYFARWETTCGVSSCASVTVLVGAAPSISTQPASQSVASGSPVTFSVVATPGSGGPLTYQWRKNAVDIGGATSSSYNIPSVTLGDAGTYSVLVTGTCGSVLSADAVLTVTGGCPADFNNDGGVDFFDYLDFVAAFDNDLPSADFNNDGAIDFFDYLDFVAAYEVGC